MRVGRRGFLGALLAAPFVGRLLPAPKPEPLLPLSWWQWVQRPFQPTHIYTTASQLPDVDAYLCKLYYYDEHTGKQSLIQTWTEGSNHFSWSDNRLRRLVPDPGCVGACKSEVGVG